MGVDPTKVIALIPGWSQIASTTKLIQNLKKKSTFLIAIDKIETTLNVRGN
jgi:hypothetical protein